MDDDEIKPFCGCALWMFIAYLATVSLRLFGVISISWNWFVIIPGVLAVLIIGGFFLVLCITYTDEFLDWVLSEYPYWIDSLKDYFGKGKLP